MPGHCNDPNIQMHCALIFLDISVKYSFLHRDVRNGLDGLNGHPVVLPVAMEQEHTLVAALEVNKVVLAVKGLLEKKDSALDR